MSATTNSTASRTATTVLTYCILGLAAVVCFVMPDKLATGKADASISPRNPRVRFIAPPAPAQARARQDEQGEQPQRGILGPARSDRQKR
jgi:hypothetical protein